MQGCVMAIGDDMAEGDPYVLEEKEEDCKR